LHNITHTCAHQYMHAQMYTDIFRWADRTAENKSARFALDGFIWPI